jgi:FAD/FMN-containing dehydrogenase
LPSGTAIEPSGCSAPLRTFGTPLIDLVRLRPYTDLQSMFDGSAPAGWHYYWKCAGLGQLDDGVIDRLVQATSCVASPASYSILFHLGGAVAEADPASTAYSRRDVAHELNVNAVWKPHETIGERERAWARRLSDALEPHRRGAYVNFFDHDDRHREADAFSPDAHRSLVALRRQFDPDAVFG